MNQCLMEAATIKDICSIVGYQSKAPIVHMSVSTTQLFSKRIRYKSFKLHKVTHLTRIYLTLDGFFER